MKPPPRLSDHPPLDGMLDPEPDDDEDEPTEEPPEEPPEEPLPEERSTADPVRSSLAGRDSGRSFACLAQAGLTVNVTAAAAAHNVTARRVMVCSCWR